MRVAIAIPTYNRLKLLRSTLDSVKHLRGAVDIHVFDNCSTDGTINGLQDFVSLGFFFHGASENTGYVGNLNRILSLADEYDWVGVLHSDDLYFCQDASALIALLEKNSSAGIVFGSSAVLSASGDVTVPAIMRSNSWSAGTEAVSRAQRQIPCSATFYSAEAIRSSGFFSSDFSYCADEEYNARKGIRYSIVEVPIWLSGYRKHEGHTMLATWRKPDFTTQFEAMRVVMNEYLPQGERKDKRQIQEEVARTLLGHASSLLALNEAKVMVSFYRYAFARAPSLFLKPHYALRLVIHFTPVLGPLICKALSVNKG